MAHGPTSVVDPLDGIPPTPTAELDAALSTLRDRAPAWCATDVAARLDLVRELAVRTLDAAPAWVAAACAAKRIEPGSSLVGGEWAATIVPVLRQLKGLETTLSDILETGRPRPARMEVGRGGQVEVRVVPVDWVDRLSVPGFTADVRLQRGVGLADAEARMGRVYRDGYEPEPAVACVLGAGNIGSIAPLDVLDQLFARDRVVVLKMSPVNAYGGPHLGEAFEPLVAAGFLRIVYGDAEVARHLVDHDHVDAVHLTGSRATHDSIVFGEGEEGRRRKAEGRPRLARPITSELGNVTPVIVVPGPWRRADLAYHGDSIATMLTQNAGFNCLTARMIVQHRSWARRRALLDAVRDSLRRAEQRHPYYPGARERWERFVTTHRSAERFGPDDGDRVPFTLIPELDPTVTDDIAFREEPFCAVMGEVALDAPRSVPEFVDAAVDFCNDTLAGTLVATIIVHPSSMRDPLVAEAVERAIDDLRYGAVVVNHWPGLAFGAGATSWGAYPGGTPTDPGSGIGVVHNSYLLEDVEKTVVRGPFRTPYTPAWFHTNRRAHELWRGIAEVTVTRNRAAVPSLVWHTARG